MTAPGRHVAVIGGGLAGMSAAVALSSRDFRITLIEKRAALGGRAGSFLNAATGEWVDNCQHVLMPCCTNLLDFYRRIGAEKKIRFYPRIPFLDKSGRVSLIQASWLPAPFHCLPSLFGLHFLDFSEKCRVIAELVPILFGGKRPGHDALSAEEWLRRGGHSENSLEKFWQLVLVSALNEDLSRASAAYAVKVLREAFLANSRGWWLGIPAAPLADLYGENVVRIVERHQGRVLLRAEAKQCVLREQRVVEVVLSDGQRIRADEYIVALPWRAAASIFLLENMEALAVKILASLTPSPITGVHLWFDRPVTYLEFAALPGSRVHWFFNKTKNFSDERSAGTQHLQLVTSASRGWMNLSKGQILSVALEELTSFLPAARNARILKSYVLKEPSATFSPNRESDAIRPPSATGIPNLHLAGDWIQTGWPATMEGAVRGGYLAAESLLGDDLRSERVLVPDLAPSGLMRLARRWRGNFP